MVAPPTFFELKELVKSQNFVSQITKQLVLYIFLYVV